MREHSKVFYIPDELDIDFQALIHKLRDEDRLDEFIEDITENMLEIYKNNNIVYDSDYARVVVPMTTEESKAYDDAFFENQTEDDEFFQAMNRDLHTALAIYALENYYENYTYQ